MHKRYLHIRRSVPPPPPFRVMYENCQRRVTDERDLTFPGHNSLPKPSKAKRVISYRWIPTTSVALNTALKTEEEEKEKKRPTGELQKTPAAQHSPSLFQFGREPPDLQIAEIHSLPSFRAPLHLARFVSLMADTSNYTFQSLR